MLLVFAFGCSGTSGESKESVGGGESVDGGSKIELLEFGNVTNAKNIILLIGDGMGPEEIRAGSLFKDGGLYMEKMPNRVLVDTTSADSTVTDSGAGGTAIACGVTTNNGYVGMDVDGDQLKTIADIAIEQGKRAGIITTEDLHGATPMDFAAHGTNRSDYEWLLNSAAMTSNINLFVSTGGTENAYNTFTSVAGYTEIESVDDISESEEDKIIGAFPIDPLAASMSDYSFDRIVKESIEYLSKDEDGFFLMAEGAHIDHGGHSNDILYMLRELLAFDLGVKAAVEWARQRDDTVVLVTADHETGGLALKDGVNSDNLLDDDDDGNHLYYSWSTTSHTGVDIYLYVYGFEVDFKQYSKFNDKDRIKNTDVFKIMKSAFTVSA